MAPSAPSLYFDVPIYHRCAGTLAQLPTHPLRSSITSSAILASTLLGMDKHLSTGSSPTDGGGIGIKQLKGLLTTKEKIPADLKRALGLLRLHNLDAFEDHFLALEAFLLPWAYFRDFFLLLQSRDGPRASPPGKMQGRDILWFYTNFDEGLLRYDPCMDDRTSLYEVDKDKWGKFDTSHWTVEEHEKFLYAWLLQEFQVGKSRNSYGFKYFELRNVCTACMQVFVPIVNAVRDAYDARGRRHYGRLALFIEERYPSRLAFPEGNVPESKGSTPFRLISLSQRHGLTELPDATIGVERPMTEKHYGAMEKELREVYPKYGQVVERPRFKTAMQDWIVTQKERRSRLKELQRTKSPGFARRSGRESPLFGCRGITPQGSESSRRSMSMASFSSNRHSPPPSPTKSKRDKKERKAQVPYGMYGYVDRSPTKQLRNPKHGVTRKVDLPDAPSQDSTSVQALKRMSLEEKIKEGRWLKTSTSEELYREGSDSDDVYSSIRNSNPFSENLPTELRSFPEHRESRVENEGGISPMLPLSAIPKPLFGHSKRKHNPENEFNKSPSRTVEVHTRHPSYEGTGYERDITPNLIAHKMHAALEYDANKRSSYGSLPPSRIPESILEDDSRARPFQARAYDIPQHIPWPGQNSPDPVQPPVFLREDSEQQGPSRILHSPDPDLRNVSTQWAPHTVGSTANLGLHRRGRQPPSTWDDESPPPPVPPKHPARHNSVRSSASSLLQRPPPLHTLGPRIISKENIRAHLGSVSPQTSEESLRNMAERSTMRNMSTSPPPTTLKTFNTHMFPRQDRKGTPVGGWMAGHPSNQGRGDDFEMEEMPQGGKQ